MEPIHHIPNQTFFSHDHWLNNNAKQQRSPELLEETLGRSFDTSSFIDMDLDFFSMRWADSHIDGIFFNGRLLLPPNQDPIASPDSVLLPPSKSSSSSSSSPCQSESSFSAYSNSYMTPSRGRFGSKQSAKSPAKILKKYLYFLVPLYKKVSKLKMISSKAVARRNAGLRGDDRRRPVMNRVYDVEAASSIHDAVLHCRKSNGECFAEEKSG